MVNPPDRNRILQAISDNESEALLFAALREVLGSGSGPAQDGINTRIAQEALALAARQFLDLMVARGLQRLGAAEDVTGLDERSKKGTPAGAHAGARPLVHNPSTGIQRHRASLLQGRPE